MKTAEEVCEALRDVVLNRQRAIVLLRHKGKSTEAADHFRAFLVDDDREKLLKSPGANPDFVKLTNGAWVFFIACEELSPTEDVGQPDYVFWPSDGGDYAQVRHRDWRLARAGADTPWRPLPIVEEDGPKLAEGSLWDKLAAEDEIG